MGLVYPGWDGKGRIDGELLPARPTVLKAGRPLTLSARIFGGKGTGVAPAIQHYVKLQALPLPPLPVNDQFAKPFFALAAAGKKVEAKRLAAKWEKTAEDTYVPPFFLGMSMIAIGEIDKALDYLDAAVDEQSAWVMWYMTDAKLDPVREHPRFGGILEKTGLPKVFGDERKTVSV